jgi:hypothetical protein
MKGAISSEDLHNKLKKLLQNLNTPVQKLVGVVTDGALSIVRMNSGFSLPITKAVKIEQAAICLCTIA